MPDKPTKVEVGQRYRDDSGYLMQVVKVEPNGDAWVRHPNQRQGGMLTRAAWFDRWERVYVDPACPIHADAASGATDAGLTARQWREQCEAAHERIADLERRIEDNMEEACDECMDRADRWRAALERIVATESKYFHSRAVDIARDALEG